MWKKENESRPEPAHQPSSPPSPKRTAPASSGGGKAIIGPSIHIKGNLRGKEDLLIEGSVEGKVELDQNQVTVGSQGKVKADIVGRMIVVEGSVEGNLFGGEQVLLSSSSSVRGNITAPRVSLDDGANFKGAIDMSSGASASGSAPAKPQQQEIKGQQGGPQKGPQPSSGRPPESGSGPQGAAKAAGSAQGGRGPGG